MGKIVSKSVIGYIFGLFNLGAQMRAQILLMRLEVCINEQEGIDQCAVITTKPDLNFLTVFCLCICADFLRYVVNRHLNCTSRSVFLSQK